MNYLHHMLFEPVSAWEKFKFDCLGSLLFFAIIGLIYLAVILISSRKS